MDAREPRLRRARVRRPRDEERPRGFEPQRMRRVWDDIDQARDKLGLAPPPVAPAAPDEGCGKGVLGLLAGALGWLGGWMTGTVSGNGHHDDDGNGQSPTPAEPAAPALDPLRLASALLASVPLVGPALGRLLGGASDDERA